MFKKMSIGLAVLGGVGSGVFLKVYRPWHSRWGAADEEVTLAMPGDEIIEKPTFNVTRAITIRARPEEIWPWIAQIGFHRAGFYSYDLLDNLGKPSADRIIPKLQHIEVGSWIPMSGKVTEETAFRVKAFEPNRWMLWEKAASTWAWKLRVLDEEHTRLIIRLKCHYRWSKPTIATDLLLMEIGDFPMMRKLMLGMKQRAEKAHEAHPPADDAESQRSDLIWECWQTTAKRVELDSTQPTHAIASNTPSTVGRVMSWRKSPVALHAACHISHWDPRARCDRT